jgi:hypothetical protein
MGLMDKILSVIAFFMFFCVFVPVATTTIVKWYFGFLSIELQWKWYDLWVGVFIDTKSRIVYICLLPTIVVKISELQNG